MSKNIVEVVDANRNLAALGVGMKTGGLDEVISKEGPFTVFAPTDLAFGKLKNGEWPEMLKSENRATLTGIMNNYIVNGRITHDEFKNGQKLNTLGGKELSVAVINGNVTIDGALIQGRDIEASNGVVHSIDKVMLLD